MIAGNVLLALGAAAAWGGGDFSGGMGVKAAGGSTRGALRVIVLAHFTSLLVLVFLVFLQQDALPHGALLLWGLGAGVAAGLGITAFYIALSRGAMGAPAAVSGLLAAAIPVLVSGAMEGPPSALQLAGFVLAGAAIWVIAAGPADGNSAQGNATTILLAIAGGVGFGVYFVALRQANTLGVLQPLTLARLGSLLTCGLLLLLLKQTAADMSGLRLSRRAVGWAMGVAVLDTLGNLLFVAATRAGRLDVAAVLASLYPASTILLAAWQLHERPTRRQAAGMAMALVAVVMITV